MLRWHVVSAVFWRNVKQYFSGPLGYLFIVIFVTVCAVMAFSPQFFANNQATLDQLSEWFPLLLLFFVPAITMTVWADEKRQGTDSILFTLPASDLDILIGKFLSVVAVYTIALLFSLTQVALLSYLGNPDWGVVLSTYFGYWLAGVALLAIGMFASSFTDSATVAFAVGAVLCAIPVLIGAYFSGIVGLEQLGFAWHLRDFTLGVISLPSMAYFLALTVFMLYLNLIVISKRHWSRGKQVTMVGQFAVRAIALAVALVSTTLLCNTAVSSIWSRVDLTSENLYTLDPATLNTLDKIKEEEMPVTIQAFVSQDVPRKYVNTKKQFLGLLRQFGEYGGSNVNVRLVEVKPNSPAALNAEKSGIEPASDRSTVGGKTVESDVFMGARISTPLADTVLPFVSDDSALEYELSRALASTIDKKNQITIGIVDTDALFGGPEFRGRRADWIYHLTIDELKQQFKIKFIDQSEIASFLPKDDTDKQDGDSTTAEDADDDEAKEIPDVLLVADPSSLDDPAMVALVKYVQQGYPTLLLADPLPFYWAFQNPRDFGILNAPKMPRVDRRSPYQELLASSDLPKASNGSAQAIMDTLGIKWDSGAACWSLDNPHPDFSGELSPMFNGRWPSLYGPYERAFVWVRNHSDVQAFNSDSLVSEGLGELLFFYPGSIKPVADSDVKFEPLVQLGPNSGATFWDELTVTPKQEQRFLDQRGMLRVEKTAASSQITGGDLVVLDPDPPTVFDDDSHVIAARVTGGQYNVNAIVIADLDFVSDMFYPQQEALGERLDNLSLLQNSIEVLAGNESFVRLRNRRSQPRTLTRLEQVIDQFREQTAVEIESAEKLAVEELEKEQAKLDKANAEVQSDQQLDIIEKLQKTGQQAMDAQRRFDLKKRRIDKQLDQQLDELKAVEQRQIERLENSTRYLAILLAPMPAFLLGIIVLWVRQVREDSGISDDRRV